MTPAVVYMRCSGIGQIDGDTWDRQLAAAHDYANRHDYEIVSEYRDAGISGKTELENRPGLAACLERIENNGVKVVLVESADRLARDAMVSEIIIREFQKAGAKVITASGVDLTEGGDLNPTAALIRGVLQLIAEFDRRVTVLKLRAARDRKKQAHGKCEGRKAFGELPEEAGILNHILGLYTNSRYSCEAIADILNHTPDAKSRSGKPWRASVIRRIIAREKARHNSTAKPELTA